MTNDWESKLKARGAVIADGRVLHFGAPAAETSRALAGDVVADLSPLSLIRARGADAVAFLQGQFSNDLNQLPGRTQLHAYCNAQGRMLALLRVFARGDDIYLQLPAALREQTLKRLKMFVLRAQVVLEPADELGAVGVSGPQIPDALARAGLAWPAAADASATVAETTVVRVPGPHPRAQLIAPLAELANFWERLPAAVAPVGMPAWTALDVTAGLPQVYPETLEAFVPQMLNLDRLGGISLNKGCYPGQEIVARMHYLGRLKQRMYRAQVAATEPVKPGDPLYAPDFGAQSAGTVVEAHAAPTGGYDLLAAIQIGSVQAGDVRHGAPDGPALAWLPLPYSLADPAQA